MNPTPETRIARDEEPDWSRQDRLLDQALEETFPASDPVAVMAFT